MLPVVDIQSLCALGDKVLGLAVYEADHSPLGLQPPCDQLGVRGEDSVCLGGRRIMSVRRREVLVQLVGTSIGRSGILHDATRNRHDGRGRGWE